MGKIVERKQGGQVLVLVALSLIVLVGLVALAVDGGSLYRERRYMQNAADAGALAGAYELCYGNIGTDAAAIDVAEDYAVNRNGADGASITVTSSISVTVVASETVQTFFAGVIGFRDVPVRAEATAVCAKAVSGGLIWPIGFPAPAFTNECDQQVVLWSDEIDSSTCSDYDCCTLYPVTLPNGNIDTSKAPIPITDTVLDANGNCRPANWPGDQRSWMDFSAGLLGNDPCDQTGCGNRELEWRIRGGTFKGDEPESIDELCQSYLEIPVCLPNSSSVRNVTWRAARTRAGDIAGIPLYDPDRSTGGIDPCTIEGGGPSDCGNNRFYVTGLGCIRVDDVYVLQAEKGGKTVRVIGGHIPCITDENGARVRDPECETLAGQAGDADVPQPGDLAAVRLVR